MSSTEFNIGLSGEKSSSRVLKPPGGGHSNIFGEAEKKAAQPRPKYDQQNSSNLNFCMNTTDPNLLVEQAKHEVETKPTETKSSDMKSTLADNGNGNSVEQQSSRGSRVPPGGFSSGGFW